ncbi:fibrous sheath-interacting protein 2 [Tiliqua scincoides]|uniref:fibrous sheath-interacting protein 2 n=1 Tax=Tiliqua scincoides TaxID=71010 RepID=UPI003462C408
MAYPNRGLLKAAMGHYLTESARTALEALEPSEGVVEAGPGRQMPAVGPNQILDMPLFAKMPFLPGSNTMFYTTNLGEKLYQPSATFDLSDPYCKIMAPKYKSLHDPHLRAYYKRKDNLRRLKKAGHITDKNKVVCTLKEFNEYRQYLTSLKLEFEKHYIREQKMLEKQITKLQDGRVLPEAADTSKYRDWLLKEERPTIQEQENVMRNRYLELINQELEKLEQLAEENQRLALAQDDKKKQGLEKRKQLLLRKKMEEEWRKKEVMLLMKIGADVKREARIEEQRRKSKEDKLKRKQAVLEKKMAHHLRKLQERFQGEGLLPPGSTFPADTLEDQGPEAKRRASLPKKTAGGSNRSLEVEKKSSVHIDSKDTDFPKDGVAEHGSQGSLAKAGKSQSQSRSRQLLGSKTSWDPVPSKGSLERKAVLGEKNLSRKASRDSEAGESLLPSSKMSFPSAKEAVSVAGTDSSGNQAAVVGSGEGSNTTKVTDGGGASACGSAGGESKASYGGSAGGGSKTSCGGPGGCGSKTSCGGPGGCGSKTSCGGPGGCGSKTSCGGPGGCGSKTSCCGSTGCGSKTSCGGPGGCGSKTSCCGSGGCGSKTSCCGSGGCGSKTSCCGSAEDGSRTSCCGSGGCCSQSGKGAGGYESSGSSRHGNSSCTGKGPPSMSAGGDPLHRSTVQTTTQLATSSAVSQHTGSEGCSKAKHKKRATFLVRSCLGAVGLWTEGLGSVLVSAKNLAGQQRGRGALGDGQAQQPAHTARPPHPETSFRLGGEFLLPPPTAIGSRLKEAAFLLGTGEAEGLAKERSSSKKRRVDRAKTEHGASTSQDNEDSESSYSAYLHRLLSNSDQSVIRESLKGKVSASELNSIIQNIMTWVVSAVTSILYPALTKFEERVRTKAYTISEESVLSSDNFSSCSTCNEDLPETFSSLPVASTRKASCTDTSLKPTTSSPSDLQTTLGKPSAKSSVTSFTKSMHVSLEGDPFKGVFKRGKTAVFLSPSKHSGLLSTTSSMRSSKSDSHICQLQKGSAEAPEKPATSHHSRHRHAQPKGLLSKTETMTTDTEGVPFGGGEYKPPHGPRDLGETICLRDLRSVLDDLKSHLTQMTAVVLEDIFKRILGDFGFSACSVSISLDVLLEAVSDSLLGSPPGGLPVGTSVSRIASFVASDLVEKVLNTLHSTAQKKYSETISKDEFSAGCKAMCIVAAGKHPAPDLGFWRARIPLSFEAVYGIAEEIVHAIIEKLKVFATSSRTKLSQFELCAKIKAIGIPLEQVYAAIPPHTVESEAANAIVKDTIRKIVSKTVASSETHIVQYVEEMITSVLSYIQRKASQEGILPARESSILLQLINDVFNDLSVENLRVLSPSAKARASPDAPGGLPARQETKPGPVTITTLHMSEKLLKKPFPPVNVPGMVLYSEAEIEGKEKKGVEGAQEKVRNEGFGLESQQRSRPGPKAALQGEGAERKTEGGLDSLVQEAIFCSFEGREQSTTDGRWTLELALKKLEEDLRDGEHSPVTQTVRNLLNEVFQHIWTEHPIWPPAAPPPSLVHMGITKQQLDEQPAPKGQRGSPAPVSDADVIMLTGDLVKTIFQKLSSATLTDTPEARSRRSSVIIADDFPPSRPTEAAKGQPVVHFRSPEMSFESGPTKEGATEEPPGPSQPDLHNPPSKPELAGDLVQTCLEKLEAFITSKVESQFCSDMQNLKSSSSAQFPAAIHQDLRQLLATPQGSLPSCLEEMFNSYHSLLVAEKEKTEQALPLSYSSLKTYAQEVAKRMLRSLKHGLDKEVEKILISPIVFSESIAASQIVNMVLAVFSPHERLADLQQALLPKESVLEKLFRKNPAYKRDIQGQIHNTVETFLNEIYQTILLELGTSPSVSGPVKCPSPGVGESPALRTGGDSRKKGPSRPAVAQSDVSLVSNDLVDVLLEDLRSGLAAGLNTKGVLSGQLQSLLYDLLQKAVQPLKYLIGRHHSQAPSKAEKAHGRTMAGLDAKELLGGQEFSPGRLTKCLVNDVLHRLESFAEDKMESEPAEAKAGSCREKAKLAVQSSQCNLRLCAEKLTCTLLKLFQRDLEQEMLSCQNILPYEENASANEIVNDLLKILSVQIALTENEVQKRVVKRIFRRKPPGQKEGAPLLARVEDVLHQLSQRILGDLGHLPSFQNDSIFLSSESKSSTYGVTEAVSQVHTGNFAGEIVDGVLDKMYSVVVDTLFSSSDSKPEVERSNSKKDPLPGQAPGAAGKSDIQKLTLALSQLQPPPRTLGEELVQNVLNKIACFAASSLEEVLPLSMKQRPHAVFQNDLQAGDGTTCRPRAFLDDSDNSLMRVSLSRSDLTVYAKDVVNKVLGSIIDDLRNEDYHRAILRINTLSSEQISIASSLVHSVVQDLHVDDGPMYFQWESTTRDGRGRRNSLFYEDFANYLRQVLPKEGILRDIFEQQPLTDANINENLKMLQVSENIVSEVLMRIRDLEPSVCILKRTSGELSERLFCCGFKRTEPSGLFHSDSQAEIGSVARDIVASVFENVHKCLVCSFPRTQDKDGFWGRRDWAVSRGPGRLPKYRFTQPDFPFYNVSLKGSTDIIDKIAKETVECTLLTLETFVARHFRRDFKCNFLEIVKFPLESLSFAQLTRSLDSLSTHVRSTTETTAETFRIQVGVVERGGGLPTLGSTQNFLDTSRLGSSITRECIETAIRQVQVLHSELSVYANNAVSGILEIIKRTLDRELIHKEATLFSSSSESLALSETISAMLDRCNESLTEITSELMVENLQLEMAGRAMPKDQSLIQDLVASPAVKTTSKRYRRIDTRDSFPPINVPGMVIYSEEETEVREEAPSKFPSVLKFSDWSARGVPERNKGVPPRSRPPGRRRQDRRPSKFKLDWLEEDWLPRQSSIPEGSILEKLFKKAAEAEGVPRPPGPATKAGLLHCRPFSQSPPHPGPEGTCCSELCPLKLGHTAETIVNMLLCEFGLENDPVVHAGHCEAPGQCSPLKGTAEPQRRRHSLLNLWEKRMASLWAEDGCLFPRGGSTLLSRWESKHCLFGDRSPERLKELELLGYAPAPDPYEIQLLANHIVLSVIKELLALQPRDSLDSLPSWRQELLQSESKWLQERIWRSACLSSSRKPSSCLDLCWEPLTQAVVSSLLSGISDPSGRQKVRGEFFEGGLMDIGCPEHGLRGPPGLPSNTEELASHIADGILIILCERNVLQETTTRKRFSGRKVKSIHVPPLCLANFDEVYQPLVREVDTLLALEFGARSRSGSRGKAGGTLSAHQQVVPRPFSGASRGDCRGPGDLKGMTCLSMMGPLAQKSQRLSCVASNLDHFIRSLKTSESKQLVNKVLRIILDSLWPSQSQGSFMGPYPDAASRNVMPYRDVDLTSKRHLLSSSACPHAYRLGNNTLGSSLGLSPKSVVLLDVVSEKLIRTLLDKCLMTEQFTGTFAFDEFQENEQIGAVGKCLSEEGALEPPGRGMRAHKVDSSSSVFSYHLKYAEEPEEELLAAPASYESALDVLAHTLVKPVMTELSLSIEHPEHVAYSRKSVGFTHPSSRKPYGASFGRRHARHGRGESYSSLARSRRPEPLVPIPGRHPSRKGMRGRNRTVLDTAMQHRTSSGRAGAAPAGRSLGGRAFSSTTSRKSYHREVVLAAGHGDQPAFSTVYSATFLEEVICQLLIKIFSSLCTKYDSESCIDLNEMNRLFVDALVGELNRAGVGVLQRAEEKAHLPRVDGQTVQRVVDSILQEFGFQLAADRGVGRDIEALAGRAAEVILMEILDYQLPPPLCRRLPQSACRPVKAERIIHRIEGCLCFPAAPRKRPPPPTYITVLSQKYLERVINRLVGQLFPSCDSDSVSAQEQDKVEPGGVNPDELCSYLMREVMKSISKHKIWVARKDDQCRLHSEKETQRMVDSLYQSMLKRSGSQLAMQKDVKNRRNSFVDSMTSFIIQEITRHHLQTFLSKEEQPPGTPDADALSETIVRTVLSSIGDPSASCAGVFPAKFLEEMVSRVLSKILGTSGSRKAAGKGQPEDELCKVVKKLASSINLQFGKTAGPPGSPKGEEQSLAAPLTTVMDDVVDSVCSKISRQREVVPEEDLGALSDSTVFDSVKRLIGKGISDCLLHPLFSGDLPSRVSPSSPSEEDELQDAHEEDESQPPFSTFLSSGFLRDIITGLLSKIFPSVPPREATSAGEIKRLPSDSDLGKLSSQLLDDVRMKLLKHEIRVTKDAPVDQYEYSEEDVRHMTDSLCSKIIQKSGSLEAVQTEVRKKSNSLIDRIAGFLVGELLQKHVQPFVSEPEAPTWDRAAAGDSMRELDVCRMAIKPWDLRQAAQESRGSPTPSSSLVQIIQELFSSISNRFSDVPLGAARDNLGDTAIRVAKSVANVLSRTQLSVQESPVEDLGSPPPEGQVSAAWKLPDKDASGMLSEDGRDSSSCQMTTLTFEEPADHPLQAAGPPNFAEAKCLIQKRLMIGPAGPLARAPVPYITVLSYPVLEAIVERLLSRIFPSPPDDKDCSFGPEQSERLAQLKKAIVVAVLKQAIWISAYGSEASIPEEAVESMVESVYCDVIHEVLLQQPLQEDRESLSNLYVTKIACFIVNEMFKYHLRSEEEAPPVAAPLGDLPASRVTVFPCRFLEVLLCQLLMKIFPDPESIAAEAGGLADFSDADFVEMAMNLKSYVITEISAHEIKLEDVSRRVPDMDQETEEDIASSVYNQILEKSASQSELQESLAGQGNATVSQLANLLIREILNFHLHPFLSGNDTASSGETTPRHQERQPFSHHIYSAMFLEDVVVAFFCKMLSSPDILAYSKDAKLSESEMRDTVVELVSALVSELKALEVKVIQSGEEDLPFPQVPAEEVVEISNSIYEKLAQEFGSELDVFRAFQTDGPLLAERLAPLIVSRVSRYQFQPLFTGDTSSYLFSFLEAETIVDRVETILPETTASSSSGTFREMFSKILHRIFPSWSPQRPSEELDPGSRSSPMEPMQEEPAFEADHSIQSLVENICKNICPKSGPLRRKRGSGTADEFANFTGKLIADRCTLESPSPPSQTLPSSRLSPKPAGWTVHRVKLGDAELQTAQAESRGDVYSSSFLKDIFSGLVSKLLSSTASVCLLEKREEPEAEPPVKTLVESILKAFARSPVKVLQVPEGGQMSPAVGQTEIAKIIHASLCGILQDRGGGTPVCTDKESDSALAERLASSIKKEILGYQIQGTAARPPHASASKPFEFGEMARKVLTEVRKSSAPSQATRPHPLLVSQRFIHDVLDALLTNILPLPAEAPASPNSEDQFAEFDFIHMKLLSKVMAEIGKDRNTKVQYLERCQPNPVASRTVANSVYGNLLPEFGDVSALEKCIKAGCTILFERIADFVIKEISGNQMQAYFSEELNRQQEAEAERSLVDDYRGGTESPEGETVLRSHLRGLSSIVIEEVAAKLLSKMFHAIPLDNIEASSISAMKEVAKKILDSLQGLISKKRLRVWQQEDLEDLGLEDSRAVGEVVDSVYTDIIKHSGSETSLYDELTNENEDFVKRVACVMVSEISRHDFQSFPDLEDELPRPSTAIKLETEKIIQKFLNDMEMEKAKKEQLAAQSPTIPVLFMEEILSRFLSKIVLAQQELATAINKPWSRMEVNDMADQLKASVEKEMSRNRMSLVAPEDQGAKLDPEDEEQVDRVVHSVFSNVLEISGSHQEMCKDVTSTKAIFPEQVASIIISEVSSCKISNPYTENIENETLSALELDRIVSKVLAQVSSHTEPGEEASLSELPFLAEDAPLLPETGEVPVKIVPYIGHKPLRIDPEILSDHLAVLSIKTEPLEKLERACLSKMGMSLVELRRASASGKSLTVDLGTVDPHKKKERRPSLDMAGRLDVKPREAVCRNSFQCLTRPDITKVELLRDVESKQDLIVRLVAHDISNPYHRVRSLEEPDGEELVLREDRSFFFEVPSVVAAPEEGRVPEQPPSEPHLPKASSSTSRKRSLSLSKCCPALTSSSTTTGLALKGKPSLPPLPQIEVTSLSRTPSTRDKEATPASQASPATSVTAQPAQTSSWTEVPPALTTESEEPEKTLEEAAVDMHLTRDTETMSGPFEITSVYQDKKVKDAMSGDTTEDEEGEGGKVVKSTSSEAPVPTQHRSSVLEKVSSALSRVFSRTSTSSLTKSAPAPD